MCNCKIKESFKKDALFCPLCGKPLENQDIMFDKPEVAYTDALKVCRKYDHYVQSIGAQFSITELKSLIKWTNKIRNSEFNCKPFTVNDIKNKYGENCNFPYLKLFNWGIIQKVGQRKCKPVENCHGYMVTPKVCLYTLNPYFFENLVYIMGSCRKYYASRFSEAQEAARKAEKLLNDFSEIEITF